MHSLIRAFITFALTPALLNAQPKAKAPPNPAFEAIKDTPGLPRVLLIGDVVSIGYVLPARKMLEGKANVHRVPVNCTSSQYGVEHVSEWLGDTKWDVIHFNFGLNDLLITKGEEVDVSAERYERNLRRIVMTMRAHSPAARLVFATTTPLPASLAKSRFKFASKDANAYATAAKKVMTETGTRINDLNALLLPKLGQLQMPETFTFRPQAYEAMAQQTAQGIEAAIKAPAPPPPASVASIQKGLRVFTAGHSFHVWVAPMIAELALDAGITDHQIAGRSGIGGSTVMKHWEVPDEKNIMKQVLRDGKADVLTLSPIWLPDEGIDNFAKLSVEHNPRILITVQEYWLPNDEYHPVYPLDTKKKYSHNDTQIPALQKAQDAYDHDMDEYVRGINAKLNTTALVTVPVGQAVIKLREKIIAGQCPGIATQAELFRDNWGHPQAPIQALSAYCHFAVIYKRSPVGLPMPSVLAKNPAWNDKLNRLLQELAWEAVTKHPMSGVKP